MASTSGAFQVRAEPMLREGPLRAAAYEHPVVVPQVMHLTLDFLHVAHVSKCAISNNRGHRWQSHVRTCRLRNTDKSRTLEAADGPRRLTGPFEPKRAPENLLKPLATPQRGFSTRSHAPRR